MNIADNKIKPSENNNKNNHDTSDILIEEENICSEKELKDDYYILIKRTKLFKIPYFNFGFITHFYLPSEKLENKMKLSEMPYPPFTTGPDSKFTF